MHYTGVDKTQARHYMQRYDGNLMDILEEIQRQQEFLATVAACEWQGKKCDICGKNTIKHRIECEKCNQILCKECSHVEKDEVRTVGNMKCEETGEKATIIEACPECKDKVKGEVKDETEDKGNDKVGICKHFLQQRCKYKGECRYRHEKEICKYYNNGGCKFGKYCMNIHREDTRVDTETGQKPKKRETETNEKEECKFFNGRGCKFGNQCKKIHKVEECKPYMEGGCSLGRSCKNVHRTGKKIDMERKRELERMENDKNEALKRGEIERDNRGGINCGLCKTKVFHWKQHIKSDKHMKKQLNEWMQETNTTQNTIFRLAKAITKEK